MDENGRSTMAAVLPLIYANQQRSRRLRQSTKVHRWGYLNTLATPLRAILKEALAEGGAVPPHDA